MTLPSSIPASGTFLLLAALCAPLQAAGFVSDFVSDFRRHAVEGKTSHALDIDNDSLLLNRDDGFYSSGLRYTRRATVAGPSSTTSFGWRIGQQLYTASDINLPPARVRAPDHPYAAWLFGGVFKETHRSDGSHMRAGIDIGCLGPCAGGEWTQKNLHRLLNQPLPQGWSRQVKNEFGVILHGEIAPIRWALSPSLDITPSFHGRFGNIHADAGAGLLVRAGRLAALPGASTLHGFFRLDGRAVAHNATLQGGYFSSGDPHTVKPKRAVGEVEAGVAWMEGSYGLLFSIVRRGNEIRALPDSTGSQNFIRLQFSYTP
ncbi:lipid A deacylase LpxR family protein [Noviherbaspirillum sp.]|uniref:lipid A deacylase LpxR family protein n=1 Tax=Noviherbaspirillum sp. TaxID=1926288 RepID=UPI002FE1C500